MLLLLVGEVLFLPVKAHVVSPANGLQVAFTVFIVLSVAFAVTRPYKSEVANHSIVCLTALMAVYCALLSNVYYTNSVSEKNVIIVVLVVLLSLPHIVFYGYVVYRLGKSLKQSDINFKAALKVLCFKQSREQNEGTALLNHA